MMEPTPSHLTRLLAGPPPVQHTWELGDDMVAMGKETPALLKNLGSLSFRALIGLQAALHEWMAARFQEAGNDAPWSAVIDAMWAASVDARYLDPDAMVLPDAVGPVAGPSRASKLLSKKIMRQLPLAEFGVVRYVIESAHLVRYVLPDSQAFQAWFKAVVSRLQTLSEPSARQAGALDLADIKRAWADVSPDVFGTPLPREAYDLSVDLSTVDQTALIDAMLQRIAATPNPYLRSAADLQRAGFTGRPYRYPA